MKKCECYATWRINGKYEFLKMSGYEETITNDQGNQAIICYCRKNSNCWQVIEKSTGVLCFKAHTMKELKEKLTDEVKDQIFKRAVFAVYHHDFFQELKRKIAELYAADSSQTI